LGRQLHQERKEIGEWLAGNLRLVDVRKETENLDGSRRQGRGYLVPSSVGGLGPTPFHGRQKITLSSGQEMLIRITAW